MKLKICNLLNNWIKRKYKKNNFKFKSKKMDNNLKKTVRLIMIFILPLTLFAQKDVTQFLDIPIDGYKTEMIQKLKSRGFTTNQYSEDILDGEFNGTNVNIGIVTNNNKVWRIAVLDANTTTDETNIKIRFNNLIQQFVNNNRYSKQADSTIAKCIIPKDEDISYEISVNNKRYEAIFHQKSLIYDSLVEEYNLIIAKDTLNDKEKIRLGDLIVERFTESMNELNKSVWFMIQEDYGKYRIIIYYDNEYNKANGEGL